MIIWRGWGILAILFIPLGAFGLGWLISFVGGAGGEMTSWSIGVGLMLAAAGLFALGWWLNTIRAEQQAAQWADTRADQLQAAVEGGYFQPTPGVSPTSLDQARQQAGVMLESERAEVTRRLRNRHSMFWVPMQWWAVPLFVFGVITLVGVMPVES